MKREVLFSLLLFTMLLTACMWASGEVIIELTATFDGNECRLTGVSELPIGNHSILYINNSEVPTLNISSMKILKGKTYQDVVDVYPIPPEKPNALTLGDWVTRAVIVGRPKLDESTGGYIRTFSFESSGEYFFKVSHKLPDADGRRLSWLCGSIKIVESPAE